MNIDQIIRTRRKTIALIVDLQGRLIVRAPLKTSESRIREIVEQKSDWIATKQQLMLERQSSLGSDRFKDGEAFYFLGKPYPLAIVDRPRPLLDLKVRFELARPALPEAEQVFEKWYRAQARQVLAERATRLAQRFALRFNRLSITGARTRWGSCGANGSLNFTWRLVMAPEDVIDYVVIHELAHLRLRNHSRKYWELVETMLPSYRLPRDWLKRNGHHLDL